jgi:hypothetical protein
VSERNRKFATARSNSVELKPIAFVSRLKAWRGRG